MAEKPEKKTDNGPSFSDVAKRLREQAEDFSIYVIGEKPTYRSGSEIRFYPNQSLVVNIAGNRKGTYRSFSNETDRGDMIDLYKMVRGASPHDAFLAACDYLGSTGVDLSANAIVPVRDRAKEEAEAREQRDKKIRTANWIWNSASPTEGREEGLAYLRGRGITADIPPDVMRFRRLSPDDLEKMGATKAQIPADPVVAIVLRATNAQSETTAVQQILTCKGQKITKVSPDFPNPKRTNGDLTGSAVKLGSATPEQVILAEGPETAMSLFQASGKPTWITLGTSNYTTLQMPRTVKEVIVAADLEESGTGLAAALRAAQFWDAAGVPKVGIALPRLRGNTGDFNDVLQESGQETVKASVDHTFYGERNRAPGVVLVSPDARAAFHVWQKTGLETIVRVPGLRGDKTRGPIMLDSLIQPWHEKVLVIPREGYPIIDEHLRKARPDLPIVPLAKDSSRFLTQAKTAGYVEGLVARETSLYAPGGLGTDEPMAFCLRRSDVIALHDAGHKAVAVRSSGIEQVDFSFMEGRKAIICPVGRGTEADKRLETQLRQAGAETTRIVWQIFRPEGDGFRIARTTIPEDYGAAEAVAEGWKGERMGDLLRASVAARAQLMGEETAKPNVSGEPEKSKEGPDERKGASTAAPSEAGESKSSPKPAGATKPSSAAQKSDASGAAGADAGSNKTPARASAPRRKREANER